MGSLSFEPLIPLPLWAAFALAAIALMVVYAWRRPASVAARRWRTIISLMACGMALVLILLLNPTWVRPETPPAGKPVLTVLVDATASMSTHDAGDDKTRYQAAARVAAASSEQLADRFDVHVATFAGNVTPIDADKIESRPPDGQVTDLADAITSSLQAERPQGQAIMLLSDGIHNADGGTPRVIDAARKARAIGCPVHTLTFGGDSQVRDLAVDLRSAQEVAFVGQKVPVAALLRQHGLAGGLATVRLVQDGKEIEHQQIALPAAGAAEVRFQVRQDKTGQYRYEVKADAFPGEVSIANNQTTFHLRVVDEPIRVLLLEGKPYWDSKFLIRTLAADQSMQLDSIVRMSDARLLRRSISRAKGEAVAPPKPGDATSAKTQEEWNVLGNLPEFLAKNGLKSYQVVVLGRDTEIFLTELLLAQIREWVQHDGGSLVCYRGQPTTQVGQHLAQMLPLRWTPTQESRFKVSLTDRGRDLRWLPAGSSPLQDSLAGLPTLATVSRAEKATPLAVVLATEGGSASESDVPAVTFQPYGSGRVVVIEGAGMWRWAFLPPQQQQQQEVYRSLWHNLFRWLASSTDLLPGQKLALRGDKTRFGTTEAATATLLLSEEAAKSKVPSVELRSEVLSSPVTIAPVPIGEEPGAFRVPFGKLPEGHYQAKVIEPGSDASIMFDVNNYFEEQLDLQARPDLMARIARESGGIALTGQPTGDLARQVEEHFDRSRPPRIHRVAAWDRAWLLLLIFGLWGIAWGVRRSSGLV